MVRLATLLEWGIYSFIFLLPWQTRLIWHSAKLNGGSWEYGSYSLYATELVLWPVLGLLLVWLIRQRRSVAFSSAVRLALQQPASRSYWLVAGFALLSGFSAFWSVGPGPARGTRVLFL